MKKPLLIVLLSSLIAAPSYWFGLNDLKDNLDRSHKCKSGDQSCKNREKLKAAARVAAVSIAVKLIADMVIDYRSKKVADEEQVATEYRNKNKTLQPDPIAERYDTETLPGKVVEPGNDAPVLAIDGKPYTTLSYANGQGFEDETHSGAGQVASGTGREHDLSRVDTTDPNFHQQALVPLRHETHGGEDVEIFARGPNAYLFHGVQDQTYIYQVMRDALGFK